MQREPKNTSVEEARADYGRIYRLSKRPQPLSTAIK
jgi:hypothetical protein